MNLYKCFYEHFFWISSDQTWLDVAFWITYKVWRKNIEKCAPNIWICTCVSTKVFSASLRIKLRATCCILKNVQSLKKKYREMRAKHLNLYMRFYEAFFFESLRIRLKAGCFLWRTYKVLKNISINARQIYEFVQVFLRRVFFCFFNFFQSDGKLHDVIWRTYKVWRKNIEKCAPNIWICTCVSTKHFF